MRKTVSMAADEILAARVGALTFANPIIAASGTYGSGAEYADFLPLSALGGIVTKSITLQPTKGNPPPRVVETAAGMLNAIGLQNEGVDHFVTRLLPPLRRAAARVIVSIAGKSEEEYETLARHLAAQPIDALEINISCPNVKAGGMAFGVTAAAAAAVTRRVREATPLPVWVKLSPNVTDIAEIARAVSDAGADALTVANTFLGMAVDIEKRRPALANITGGLSGPCIHPLALRLVWQVRQAVGTPIVACGGVRSIREILAFLMVGASAVQVGTMNFIEPGICLRLKNEIAAWCQQRHTRISEIIGSLSCGRLGGKGNNG